MLTPPVSGATLSSVKSGNWSDATLWSPAHVPVAGDIVTIAAGHAVVLDVNTPNLASVTVASTGALTFAPAASTLLKSTGSVIVRGTLTMKPSAATVVHRLLFVNVNESTYVGGGLEPVPADVGLWVRDGVLDLEGTAKTAWTRVAGSVNASATSITLEAAPTGWRVGDEISIVPTEPPSVGDPSWSGFDPEYRGYNLAGFMINQGLRNTIRDSVAVGVQGNVDASGFEWPEGDTDDGVWNFSKGNIAHNNEIDGIFAWQNDHQPHVIANDVGYHNGETGIDHGAYGNAYHYENSVLYGNGVAALRIKGVGTGVDEFGHLHLRFDNMVFDGGGQSPDLIRAGVQHHQGRTDVDPTVRRILRG